MIDRKLFPVFALFVLILSACSAASATQTAVPEVVSTSSVNTPTPGAATSLAPSQTTPTETSTLDQTPTPTFPLELTRTPGIQASVTAYMASATAYQATNLAEFGPMALLNGIRQYFNPVGTPLNSWHDVPIMPQATAGQEFNADIYSFVAPVAMNVADRFYGSKSASLNWTCIRSTGSSGSGSQAAHRITLLCTPLIIVINSLDSDPNQTIVVIGKAP